MLKRLMLILALMIGAFVVTGAPSQAAPLGATSQAQSTAPSTGVEKAYYVVYRRRYRPRYYGYRRYYRPRFYGYRRYYRPRYYRRYWY